MSNTKSVEQQLKEAIEASKQTLALSEQVTSLASEKEALSKRLAEIETALSAPKASEAVAVDPLIVEKLGELLAERELTAKVIKQLQANVVYLAKESKKHADLNEYVKQRMEDGEEGTTPAEKQHLDAGKKGRKATQMVEEEEEEEVVPSSRKAKKSEMPQFIKDKIEEKEEAEAEEEEEEKPVSRKAKKARAEMPEFIKEKIEEREEEEEEKAESCGPKGKKAFLRNPYPSKAPASPDAPSKDCYDESSDNELTEDEMEMLREYRNARNHKSKKGRRADSTLNAPLKEETKDFGDIIPQPGLDPEKNNVNEDNTTHPTINKLAKKASMKKGETDVEEIMESPDMQESEDESDHEHEKTLSEPAPGAKKGKKASKAGDDEIPAPLMEYLKQLVQQEKEKKETAKRGENSLPGMNKHDVVGQPDQDEEESVLEKKDAKKGKRAESPETTKVHEEGCADTDGNTTEVGDTAPLAKTTLDSVVDVAVSRLAEVAKAKKKVEAELAKAGASLASETKSKDEAWVAVAQLQAKFESLMGKFAQSEASDRSLEAKAAKIMAVSASEPVSADIQGSDALSTPADYLAKFEAISDAREKNKFFKTHAAQINLAVQANLKRSRLS
jgi:hypothetical protein